MDNPETRAELGTINKAKTNKMKIRNHRKKQKEMVSSFFYDTRGVIRSQVR